MTRSLVITGVDGFVGRHVAREAHASGWRVIGIGRAPHPDRFLLPVVDEYHEADLREAWPLSEHVDGVIHLAALAAVGPSFEHPQDYIGGNTAMVTFMAEALLSQGFKGRLLCVSSGAVYASPAGLALSEEADVVVSSPYAVSKLAVELQMKYYALRGIDTVTVRPFNHIGPGQREGFLLPDLYAKCVALAPGARLKVGNLSTRRDYLDVRDVARAYVSLLQAPRHERDLYNVALGSALGGNEILAVLCAELGRSVPDLEVDASKLRPTDAPEIRGSSDALRREFGWAPRFSVAESVRDFVAEMVQS